MQRIQGKKQKMGTYEINKISLSVFDDKRFVLNDDIHALPYFDKEIDSHRWKKILIKKDILTDEKKNSHEKEETVTDKKEFSWKRKDSHKWLQIKTNACK